MECMYYIANILHIWFYSYIYIHIFTWQRLPIPPRSACAGTCDQVNTVQSNTVLCMVLLKTKSKKGKKFLNVWKGSLVWSGVCCVASCCILSLFLGRSCFGRSLLVSLGWCRLPVILCGNLKAPSGELGWKLCFCHATIRERLLRVSHSKSFNNYVAMLSSLLYPLYHP